MRWLILRDNSAESRTWPIAEIELYWTEERKDRIVDVPEEEKWSCSTLWLDSHTHIYATGLSDFVRNEGAYLDTAMFKMFQRDLNYIENLRGWLHEIYYIDSKLKKSKSRKADKQIEDEVYEYYKGVLTNFCEKYHLYLSY